jgi:hypothetical protein
MEDVKATVLHKMGVKEMERQKTDYCHLLQILEQLQFPPCTKLTSHKSSGD